MFDLKKKIKLVFSLGFSTFCFVSFHLFYMPTCDIDNVIWDSTKAKWPNLKCNYYIASRHRSLLEKRILVIGDSLSRRFAITLAFTILGENDTHKLGSDIFTHGAIFNVSNTNIDFIFTPCINHMSSLIEKFGHKYDLIVASSAIHYTNGACMSHSFHNDFDSLLFLSNQILDKTIWRTQPLSNRKNSYSRLCDFYQYVLKHRDSITVLDDFNLLRNKSLGYDRIRGNTKDHFGVDARIAMVNHFLLFYYKHMLTFL